MICVFWGKEKSGKTTCALTFPRPLFHMDLDVGGFARASWRVDLKDVVTKPYATPVQIEKMLGQQREEEAGKITLRMPKKVIGMKELWTRIVVDYVKACQDQNIKTIVIDSGTQLWSICHKAYLQELQEKQLLQGEKEAHIRAQLLSIEYGEPNDRMKSLVFTARTYNKNLVLTHYPKDVYAQRPTEHGIEDYRTGEIDIDGFKQTKALSDICIYTDQRKTSDGYKMMAKITLSGLGITLIDQEFQDLTYDKLIQIIKMSRGEK